MFHWASTSQGAKQLPPLKQAENGCTIENGSQLLLKINNPLRISLTGIYASGSQVEGIRSRYVLFRVIGQYHLPITQSAYISSGGIGQ